ncbi:MAG: Rab family GTPase [Candidatus Hodarchaeota archaeon]
MSTNSRDYSKVEALEALFNNFESSLRGIQAMVVMDVVKKEPILSVASSEFEKSSLDSVLPTIKNQLDRLFQESQITVGPSSSISTGKSRLIFVKVKKGLVCLVIDANIGLDAVLPYAYLVSEKINSILDKVPVELTIPLINVLEEEGELSKGEKILAAFAKSQKYQFKHIVIGDEAVGKTTLIYRFAESKFKDDFLPTLGVSLTVNKIFLHNARVTLNTWDMGGQKHFRRVRASYYEGAHSCFIIFDLTNRQSFENILSWNEEKTRFAGNVITILLGNKADLVDKRVVSREEARAFAGKNGFSYMETSVLSGAQIHEAFALISYKLVALEAKLKEEESKQ